MLAIFGKWLFLAKTLVFFSFLFFYFPQKNAVKPVTCQTRKTFIVFTQTDLDAKGWRKRKNQERKKKRKKKKEKESIVRKRGVSGEKTKEISFFPVTVCVGFSEAPFCCFNLSPFSLLNAFIRVCLILQYLPPQAIILFLLFS